MRSRAITSLVILTTLSPILFAGALAPARAAAVFPQGNPTTFSPPTLSPADGTVEAGQPTLNQRADGYEVADFSYTVTANRVGAISVTWSALRDFNLDPASNLRLRIKGDALVSLVADNVAHLTVNGYVNGILPANLGFTSDNLNGPQNQQAIMWDRTGEPITRDAGNGQTLQMDSGVNWLPNAIGDQMTISARSEIRITEAAAVDVPGPAAVAFAVRAAPNPAPGALRFTVALPKGSHVRLGIYDLGGRRIATLIDRTLDPGSHTVEWAANDSQGHRLSSGLYLFRLTAGPLEQRGKVALID